MPQVARSASAFIAIAVAAACFASPPRAAMPVPVWTAGAPAVSFTAPAGGEVWTAASTHAIEFQVLDEDASLTVWINLSLDAGLTWSPLSPGTLRPSGTNFVPVPLPVITTDETGVVRVTARDAEGLVGSATSAPFTVDGTAPAVTGSVPALGETGVSPTAPFAIAFSERMEPISTEAATSLSPGTWPLAFAWSGDGRSVTIDHGVLQAGTPYTLRVDLPARDTSDPGNPLAPPYAAPFTLVAATVTAVAGGPYAGIAGEPVTLDGSASTGPITNWTWEIVRWGGGSSWAYGPAPVHTFAAAGHYHVWLTVRDVAGNADVDAIYARIEAPDTTPPRIEHTPLAVAYVGDAFDIYAKVTDPESGVREVHIEYTSVVGEERDAPMALSGHYYEVTIPAQSAAGTVGYRFRAVDAEGNQAVSPEYTVAVRELPWSPPASLPPTLLAVAVVAIVVSTLLSLRWRRRNAGPSAAPPMEPAPR